MLLSSTQRLVNFSPALFFIPGMFQCSLSSTCCSLYPTHDLHFTEHSLFSSAAISTYPRGSAIQVCLKPKIFWHCDVRSLKQSIPNFCMTLHTTGNISETRCVMLILGLFILFYLFLGVLPWGGNSICFTSESPHRDKCNALGSTDAWFITTIAGFPFETKLLWFFSLQVLSYQCNSASVWTK